MPSVQTLLVALKDRTVPSDRRLHKRTLLFLLVLSVIAVTICSKCSPLYPLNNWDDANCFFTVGKAIWSGQVPYRDIFEQKGPLLYFIYAGAALVSGNSFFGAYLLEIVAGFFYLLLCAKTMLLFCDKKVLSLLPLLTLAVYVSPAFEQGGSAEEFCLPLLMYSVYIGVKAIVLNHPVGKREWLVIGITSGAVLWIKFTLLGFYFGFGMFMLFYYALNRLGRELIYFLVFLLLGEVIIAAPILLYFWVNHALYDLFEVYFYCNLFLYPVTTEDSKLLSLLSNLKIGFASYMYNFWISFVMLLMGLPYLYLRSKRLIAFAVTTFTCTFVMIYVGGRCYAYYPLVMALFMPTALIALYQFRSAIGQPPAASWHHRKAVLVTTIGILLGIALLMVLSPNTYMLGYRQDRLPQYQFSRIIRQTDNATLLNYGFLDGGFYIASDTLPVCRFFCRLNIPHALHEQDTYVSHALTDYIVTRDEVITSEQYVLVRTMAFETRRNSFNTFYLYRRKSLSPS